MPSLPNSLERLLTRPTTAARTELESTRSVIGCFTEIEVMVMIRPQRWRCMWGIAALARCTVLIRFNSTALRHSSAAIERKFLAGGPPALATQTSIRPNRFARSEENTSELQQHSFI